MNFSGHSVYIDMPVYPYIPIHNNAYSNQFQIAALKKLENSLVELGFQSLFQEMYFNGLFFFSKFLGGSLSFHLVSKHSRKPQKSVGNQSDHPLLAYFGSFYLPPVNKLHPYEEINSRENVFWTLISSQLLKTSLVRWNF